MADETGAGHLSRRDFIRASVATSATLAAASLSPGAFAAGSDRIRVGLIGCGGRGSGAARDCAAASQSVQIVALGDLFSDRLNGARSALANLGEQFKVTDDRCFLGFDAYQKVLATDVDLVILATAPGFRPQHITAAIEASKHVFAEKPVATDPVGVRSVIESAQLAKEKNLSFVAGTQRRHDPDYIEIINRIHDGAIGDLVSGSCYWNQGGLWMKPRKSEWSDMEWQIRNWLYFTWLSGDHICEQHVHQLDVMNWIMGSPPAAAYGMGGRQVRVDPAYGNIFDHFAIEYTYPNGARVMSMCRQIDGTTPRIQEIVAGTRGTADAAESITGEHAFRISKVSSKAKEITPYQLEHVDLIKSIQSGKPINEARQVAESTLTAIMGRMSAYTGKVVSWDQAMKSQLNLFPSHVELGPIATPPVAVPGKEHLV
jgi:predicted dehydrogenase